jgi:putative transposase
MLLRNDLLRYEDGDGRTVRVLWLRPDSAGAAIIDVLADQALPTIVQLDALIQDLQEGRARLLNPDPYLVLAVESALLDGHKGIRDTAWGIIKELVEKEPDIYRRDRRGNLLKAAMVEHEVTLKTLYRYLRRYWQRGQTPNALLPDYANSGGRGKARKFSEKKRGRPRIYGDQKGINVTSDIRQIFRVAVDRYYAESGSKFTLKGAYSEMIRTFFSERRIDPDLGEVFILPWPPMLRTVYLPKRSSAIGSGRIRTPCALSGAGLARDPTTKTCAACSPLPQPRPGGRDPDIRLTPPWPTSTWFPA